MEKYPSFIVDAFTKTRFTGNPAAVCLIPQNLKDEEYQKIAAEFNLSETAFPVPIGSQDFKTLPLCGHATLATSHVLFNEIGNINKQIKFDTQSGVLIVEKENSGNSEMNFPRYDISSVKFSHTENPLHGLFSEFAAPPFLFDIIKCIVPTEMIIESVAFAPKAKKLIVVVDPQTTKFELEAVQADCQKMLELHDGSFVRGIAITVNPKSAMIQGFVDSSNDEYDYACRYFAPWVGINEDPATGSAQCALGPFWATILQKNQLYAFQSYPKRGAQFRVKIQDDRVILNGSSVTVMSGQITLDEPTFY